jgi:hypothetical protein
MGFILSGFITRAELAKELHKSVRTLEWWEERASAGTLPGKYPSQSGPRATGI